MRRLRDALVEVAKQNVGKKLIWLHNCFVSDMKTSLSNQGHDQGDQIGRIFAHWVIVYSRQFLKSAEVAHIFGLLFSTVKVWR
jgi:hypothetical protein